MNRLASGFGVVGVPVNAIVARFLSCVATPLQIDGVEEAKTHPATHTTHTHPYLR